MINDDAIFSGDVAKLEGIDINAVIESAGRDDCFVFSSALNQKADSESNQDYAAAYRFLATLLALMVSEDSRNPYAPWAKYNDGSTSVTVQDLTDGDLNALRVLAPLAKSPRVRGRLFDVLWLRGKNKDHAEEACRAFLEAGWSENPKEWYHEYTATRRAMQLASVRGRQTKLYHDTLRIAEDRAKAAAVKPEGLKSLHYITVLLEEQSSDPAIFIKLLEENAEIMAKAGDHYNEQHFLAQVEDWYRLAKDPARAKAAKIRVAESVLRKAEARMSGPNRSSLAASIFFAKAVELLRQAGASPKQLAAAKKRLNEVQAMIVGEMQSFTFTADLTAAGKEARDFVREPRFEDALFKFTYGIPLANPLEIRAEVAKNSAESPLSALIGKTIVDEKGRTVAKVEGLHGNTPEAAEAAMKSAMWEYATQFVWGLRASAIIGPARMQILEDHNPSLADIRLVVRGNSVVPQGHEAIIFRGLYAGFHGDFITAAHFLIPQVEELIRHILEQRGVDISVLKPDLTQPLRILGGLLDHPQTEMTFGPEWVFELRGLLNEKAGFNLRNRVAHGMITDSECYSSGVELVWWHVLRLCAAPLLARQIAGPAPSPAST